MTLVFHTGTGPLQQVQVGPADVAATISIAHSVWGWVGGLDTVRSILDSIQGAFSDKTAQKLAAQIPIGPAVYHIFTRSGPVPLSDDNLGRPFGGDFRTRLIGLS